MFKWLKGFIVGLSICSGLVVLGIPSTAHANYGMNVTYGYKVPKALHGKWYNGSYKYVFTGYGKFKNGKTLITQHLVKGYCYVNGKAKRVKVYSDGVYFYHEQGFDIGEEYVPLIFSYHGHHHKGLDVTGHSTDFLYTRVKTKKHLSLSGYGSTKKVKLVHFGF